MTGYVGRLAPSPTGAMHLGIARTLLAAWLDARAAGGRLLLRMEDIDRPRVVPGAADALMRELEWLGLTWDGPVSWQSAHDARYEAAVATLLAAERAFPCTCTRREVQAVAEASAPHGPGDDGPRYSGTCRDPARRRPDRPAALRFRTRAGDHVVHEDLAYGRVEQDVDAAVGDFVVRRSDGLWAYQLAVTVDDLAQGVTRVVRGADLLWSTPRQLLLRRVLAPDAPPLEALHVPLVRAADGRRLAKRDGDAGVASRRARGEPAEEILGVLGASLGLLSRAEPLAAVDLIPLWGKAARSTHDTVLSPSGLAPA
jgi:glutamyl-tRNA synthetase